MLLTRKSRDTTTFETNGLIVGQMQMQHVHFHLCQAIDHVLQHVKRNKVPGHIHQNTAPGIFWLVFYRLDLSGFSKSIQLTKRGDSNERTERRTCD